MRMIKQMVLDIIIESRGLKETEIASRIWRNRRPPVEAMRTIPSIVQDLIEAEQVIEIVFSTPPDNKPDRFIVPQGSSIRIPSRIRETKRLPRFR